MLNDWMKSKELKMVYFIQILIYLNFYFFQFDRKNQWSKWWKRVSLSKDIWDHIRLGQVSRWYARLMEVSFMTKYFHYIESNNEKKLIGIDEKHCSYCIHLFQYHISTHLHEWVLIYAIVHYQKVYVSNLGSKGCWVNSLVPLFAECPREKRFCLHFSTDDSAQLKANWWKEATWFSKRFLQ